MDESLVDFDIQKENFKLVCELAFKNLKSECGYKIEFNEERLDYRITISEIGNNEDIGIVMTPSMIKHLLIGGHIDSLIKMIKDQVKKYLK